MPLLLGPGAVGQFGAAEDAQVVKISVNGAIGEGRPQSDAFAAVEALRDAFEGVELRENFGGDGPEFAADALMVARYSDHAGVFAEIVEPVTGGGARFAQKGLAGEDAMVGATAFEGAVNKKEDGRGFRRHRVSSMKIGKRK